MIQSIGASHTHTVSDARRGRRARLPRLRQPGGGCQFLARRRPHRSLPKPSGSLCLMRASCRPAPIWRDLARRWRWALRPGIEGYYDDSQILTEASSATPWPCTALRRSTNLIAAHSGHRIFAGLPRPSSMTGTRSRTGSSPLSVLPNVRFTIRPSRLPGGGVPKFSSTCAGSVYWMTPRSP